MTEKEFYTSPEVKVFNVRIEGVICQSTGTTSINDWENGITLDF